MGIVAGRTLRALSHAAEPWPHAGVVAELHHRHSFCGADYLWVPEAVEVDARNARSTRCGAGGARYLLGAF